MAVLELSMASFSSFTILLISSAYYKTEYTYIKKQLPILHGVKKLLIELQILLNVKAGSILPQNALLVLSV